MNQQALAVRDTMIGSRGIEAIVSQMAELDLSTPRDRQRWGQLDAAFEEQLTELER